MLRFLFQDAMFGLAVAIETVALTRLVSNRFNIPLQPGLDPISNAYQTNITDRINAVTHFLSSGVSSSYNDAYLISAILFFLFFIAQARRAMASDPNPLSTHDAGRDRVEVAVDAILPVAACVVGAILTAFTLLPLLTPLPAVWLLVRRIFSAPGWFGVSRTFYVNCVAVAGLTGCAIYFFRQ